MIFDMKIIDEIQFGCTLLLKLCIVCAHLIEYIAQNKWCFEREWEEKVRANVYAQPFNHD